MPRDNTETKTIGFRVPEAEHETLKDLAYERRTTISELFRPRVDELLAAADEELDRAEAPTPDGGRAQG